MRTKLAAELLQRVWAIANDPTTEPDDRIEAIVDALSLFSPSFKIGE